MSYPVIIGTCGNCLEGPIFDNHLSGAQPCPKCKANPLYRFGPLVPMRDATAPCTVSVNGRPAMCEKVTTTAGVRCARCARPMT